MFFKPLAEGLLFHRSQVLTGIHQSLVFLGSDAVPGSGTPLNTGRPHLAGHLLPALYAVRFHLVRPDLIRRIAPETPHLFRIGGPYFSASWATFLHHLSFIVTDTLFLYMSCIIKKGKTDGDIKRPRHGSLR